MASSLVWEQSAGFVYTGEFLFSSLCLLINFSSSLYSRILDVYKELIDWIVLMFSYLLP